MQLESDFFTAVDWYLLFLTGLAFAAVIYGGKLLLYKELEDAGKGSQALETAGKLWTCCAAIAAGTASAYYLFIAAGSLDIKLLFSVYLFLFSTFVSIVDIYTHSLYVELLPGLLAFPLIGWVSNGFCRMAHGLAAGICLNVLFIILERVLTGKVTYGCGDFLFGIAASALVTSAYFFTYWLLVAVIFCVYFIVLLIKKKIQKERLSSGEMVPLLPALSLSACLIYLGSAAGLILPYDMI